MAENIIKSRIMLKYDTLANWTSSSLVLKQGEIAIAEIPSGTSDSGLTPPAIGIKVGNNTATFSNLPWIQAVAGDVYAWAKAATPPSADQISGLSDYISGHINDTNTSYKITTGSGLNVDKYFLESKDVGSDTWTTVSTIDLSSMSSRISALETWTGGTTSLADQIAAGATTEINKLDYTDAIVEHQFVTKVSESDGKISVTRGNITAADITSGTFAVARGGTGTTYFDSGKVLVGNGTGAIMTKSIDSEVANNSTNLITSGAVKTYVDNTLTGISGAMHFIGIANSIITDGQASDPYINNYNISNAKNGDVIATENGEEYVWYDSAWHILGPENIYAVSGQIKNSDIKSDAAIAQTKIAGSTAGSTLADDISNKVDKINGKGLSTNDYTTAEQTKLSGIETGAEVNIIESVLVNGAAVTVSTIDRSISLGALAGKNTVTTADLSQDILNKLDSTPTGLHDIAYNGDVGNLTQTTTYLVIDCGNGSDKLYN